MRDDLVLSTIIGLLLGTVSLILAPLLSLAFLGRHINVWWLLTALILVTAPGLAFASVFPMPGPGATAMHFYFQSVVVSCCAFLPNEWEIQRMAKHYGLDPADLERLAAKMEDWTNHAGGVDQHRLYWVTRVNLDGRWDWYEIGGRWHGYIKGSSRDVIRAGALLKSRHLNECLPANLVADGTWLACERFVSDGALSFHVDRKSDEQWLEEV